MTSISRDFLARACTAALLSIALAGPAPAQTRTLEAAPSGGASGELGLRQGGGAACAPTSASLRTGTTLGLRSRGEGGVGDSYHCCDADGTNCSGSVDALTICPVIKVRCREEDNACICD